MIRVDEFTYLYRLKDSKEYKYYELLPWVRKVRFVTGLSSFSDIGNPSSSLCLGMIGRLLLMKFGVTSLGCSIVGKPRV